MGSTHEAHQEQARTAERQRRRLKGWLRDAAEAVEELKDPEAAQFFNTTLRLGSGNTALLLQ